MKIHTKFLSSLQSFLRSPTARLASTYLLIILVMSISFSFVIYVASSHELGRQVPPDALFEDNSGRGNAIDRQGRSSGPGPEVDEFFRERIAEARQALATRLVLLNALMLVGGAVVSYWLARRNLEPIEAAMDAQSQFVSDASHELRTPLTAIQTSNEVALRKPNLTLAQARALIVHNTEDVARLKALSDGLLSLARQENAAEIPLSPISLQDIVSNATNQIIELAQAKNISLHDNVSKIAVLANAAALERVLVILLDNAIKYSPAKASMYVISRQKGRQVYLDIRDEGIGIEAADLPHVFKRFYRADNSRTSGGGEHGYGLGLAIARQIMRGQHGDITVVSTPGQGSTFTLRLNRA